jgi:hypothetical protein
MRTISGTIPMQPVELPAGQTNADQIVREFSEIADRAALLRV